MKSVIEHKIHQTNNGMTLTELLVASVLVGIVMLAVLSFGLAIRQMQGSTSRSVILTMRTKAAMARIAGDAISAVGDQTNRGVAAFTTGSSRSICFRQDGGDPSRYNDDNWVCYYKDINDRLWHCNEPSNPAEVPVNTMAKCNNGGASDYLLDINDAVFANFFNIQLNAGGRLEYIELILAGVYDRSDPIHPIENPEYTVTTRISPPGHSR
jgi:prepilin-type N-terminal cleavage/methylation domain-containing protein